ncbi:golgi re-assembly stacking protein 2 [Plasmodium sp. gorilla clade G3]|nr:golgi re-assembly stacking protein 2 [Plasmodium sp. gorilla clade G3]
MLIGYRILRISENSPCYNIGLEIFFDYIIQIDDLKLLDSSKSTYDHFIEKIKLHENKELTLDIYNCRYDKIKKVKVIPEKWEGNGLLGIHISYELLNALNEGVRILEILENSPAYQSQLIEYEDFIIGYDKGIFRNQDEFMRYINMNNIIKENSHDKKVIFNTNLYVYNYKNENIRKVQIQLNDSWGGKGLLGCNVATGYLHKIPTCQIKGKEEKENINLNESFSLYHIKNNENECNNYKKEHLDNIKINDLEIVLLGDSVGKNPNDINNNESTEKDSSNIIPLWKNEAEKSGNEEKNYINSQDVQLNHDNNINYMNNDSNSNGSSKTLEVDMDNNAETINYDDKFSYELKSTLDDQLEEDIHEIKKEKFKNEQVILEDIKREELNNSQEIKNEMDTYNFKNEDIKDEIHMIKVESINTDNDKTTRLVDSYSDYVKKMTTYSKEMNEIYESMNKNSEILNSIKMNATFNYVNDNNNILNVDNRVHTDEYKNVDSQEIPILINPYKNTTILNSSKMENITKGTYTNNKNDDIYSNENVQHVHEPSFNYIHNVRKNI